MILSRTSRSSSVTWHNTYTDNHSINIHPTYRSTNRATGPGRKRRHQKNTNNFSSERGLGHVTLKTGILLRDTTACGTMLLSLTGLLPTELWMMGFQVISVLFDSVLDNNKFWCFLHVITEALNFLQSLAVWSNWGRSVRLPSKILSYDKSFAFLHPYHGTSFS